MVVLLTKYCGKCRRSRPVCNFFVDRSTTTGLTASCKDCSRERSRSYRRRRAENDGEHLGRVRKKTNKPHRCTICGETKFLTAKNFDRVKGGKQWSPYCKECRREQIRRYQDENREKYNAARRAKQAAETPEEREVRLAKSREYSRTYRLRHQNDPEYWERRRMGNALYREKKGQKTGRSPIAPVENFGSGPEMPVKPLMEAIDAWIKRHGYNDEEAADRLGVASRRFREWRTSQPFTRMSVADRCMTRMGLLWWEVWDEAKYPEVAEIWEG